MKLLKDRFRERRITVAVCQNSGKKWILPTNAWFFSCVMRHGVSNFSKFVEISM